ncbi:trypsin-like peptidase domain-containing protein [Staphylococcus sp. ACRSN]|uniref:trypsin-like peptidase domain-containing protein n=1 Tax=Staphylococcus sp. ACRSN TaxID=2918214 RepID=UPI001EF2D939|nr:trypsin-like peptidase domain-containing protein [Staphylococcus sp. ACRSN]MCG7339371.1 trypsin-like peptidase domain-containing protein [Staphylococcus sp. ACRSN]
MTHNKKQVIPKAKYGRKRREYFHNEERENRIQLEQQQKEVQAAKEEKLAKNNEERVKDNLRKARIEKLTQEEIQQQQAQAADRQNEGLKTEQTSTQQLNEAQYQDTTEDANSNDYFDLNLQSQTDTNKELDTKNKTEVNTDTKHSKNTISLEDEKLDNETSTEDNKVNDSVESETTSNDKKNKQKLQKTKTEEKQQDYFYSEEAQKNRVDKYVDDDKDYRYKTTKDDYKQKDKSNHESTWTKIKSFFREYWAQVLIVLAVILVLTLINAIFYNVDQSGNTKDSIFQTNKDNNKTYTDTMKNANNAVHSVVTVDNDTSNGNSSAAKETQEADKQNELGSGVVYKKVDDSIFILTNAHVVGDKKQQKITYGNDKYTIGKVIGSDKFSDVAIVKAKIKDGQGIKPIKLGDSSTLVLGEPIIVVGNPLGNDFKGSVSEGIISGLNRHVPVDIDKDNQYDVLMKAFQMDAPVNPGNSGGAVIDRDGKLIGIASLKIDMDNVEGMAFAIPINDAQSIAKELEDKGEVKYPNSGAKLVNVAELDDSARTTIRLPDDVNEGVVVADVKKDSLANKSGLQKNDVIVELDGKDVEDNLRYRQIIFSHKDDLKTLPAKVYRNGKLKDINIKLK